MESAIQQERATLIQLQSDMQHHKRSTDQRYSTIMHGKEGMLLPAQCPPQSCAAAARHKCLTLDGQLAQLRAQLSHQSTCNVEIQINRDAAKSRLAAVELQREGWRVAAIDRVSDICAQGYL